MKKPVKYILPKAITKLIKFRLTLVTSMKNVKDNEILAKEIEEDILKSFKKYYDKYSIDFIIETLTHFGDCPAILYDDNGLFAVVSAGVQPTVTGKEKIGDGNPMTYFPEKEQWKTNIRAAVKYYLKH